MRRYRCVASIPSMLAMGDAVLDWATGLEENTRVRFTHLAMNTKRLPLEFAHGVFGAVVETSAETIDLALNHADSVTGLLLDILTTTSGAATSEPFWLFALRIDPDAVSREVLVWDLWNRAPEFHRFVDRTMADAFQLWHNSLAKISEKQMRRLAHAMHWFRLGLDKTRAADRFTTFWSALEALDAPLLKTAPTWRGSTPIPPEHNQEGKPLTNRGIMLLGRNLTTNDATFRDLLRFRNDLLHGNIYPPSAQDPIDGRDVTALLWVMEGLQRILELNPQDAHVERWRTNIQDFRVLGNVRIVARGQFWGLPAQYWQDPEHKPPLAISMKDHGKVLLIQHDSRISGPFELKGASLWGARQYHTLPERGLSIDVEDRAKGTLHDNPYTQPARSHKKKSKKRRRLH